MKDAKGHGSNGRGGALDTAITNFQAAHQSGVNEAVPNRSGRDLYNAVMAAHSAHPHNAYDPRDLRQMEPEFDEMPAASYDPWYPNRRGRG